MDTGDVYTSRPIPLQYGDGRMSQEKAEEWVRDSKEVYSH
jgi:hypothetical protein